jgi:hypothetical protein
LQLQHLERGSRSSNLFRRAKLTNLVKRYKCDFKEPQAGIAPNQQRKDASIKCHPALGWTANVKCGKTVTGLSPGGIFLRKYHNAMKPSIVSLLNKLIESDEIEAHEICDQISEYRCPATIVHLFDSYYRKIAFKYCAARTDANRRILENAIREIEEFE